MFEVEKLKKRWRNLRDSYKKAKNKMTEYIPSGSEAPLVENKKDGFWYYDQMTFLNDTMISRPSISNVSNTPHVLDSNSNIRAIEIEENKDGDILESSSISNFTSFSEHTKRLRKQSSDNEFRKNLLKVISESDKTSDGIEGFLLQLGDILRKLPYRNRRQFQTKILIDALKVEEEAGLL
ncbi:uncharacterized protein LOC105206457 isoform X1 [Solenopsis invicta]|uniref:uncharacterized protein LOC105206457 isoform X1 n=1 Tax=Solenopsis invicta TaxID=13686 RepID=UPI00193E648E|nr:uncharacterized protein LOC105206457 isoform X1 [Solenopsis invicta]